MSRAVKELKSTSEESRLLKPGEQKVVQFTLGENDLKFYNAQLQHVAEPGEFNVQIGLDSQNVQQNSFQLQ